MAYGYSYPQFISYLRKSDEYVTLTPNTLNALERIAKIRFKGLAEASLMDKIGSKILLSSSVPLALYGTYISYFVKVAEVEEEERIVYLDTV